MGIEAGREFGMDGYDASTYGDKFAEIYDTWYSSLEDDDFVQFVADGLPSDAARVLELGVGTGRLIERLQSVRTPVSDHFIGVDSSQSMLDLARGRLATTDVVLSLGDFSQTIPTGPFDLIFIGYNTLFNLPDAESVGACFALAKGQLAPGGSFCIDAVMPRAGESGDDVSVRTMTRDEVVLSITQHDAAAQRIQGQFVQFTHGAQVVLRPWVVRYFTPEQLDELAGQAGLRLVDRFADGTGTEFTPDSTRHVSRYRLA